MEKILEYKFTKCILIHSCVFILRLYLMKVWKPFTKSLTNNELKTVIEGIVSEDEEDSNLSCEILWNSKISFLQTFKILNYNIDYKTLQNNIPNPKVFEIFGDYILTNKIEK